MTCASFVEPLRTVFLQALQRQYIVPKLIFESEEVMTPIKLHAASLFAGLFLIAGCMAKPATDNQTTRTYFWDSEHLHGKFKNGSPAKVCYSIQDGKVHCFVHAWMTDDEKRLLDSAPPPAFFLTDFHRPQPIDEHETRN